MTSPKSPNRRASPGDPLDDLLDNPGARRAAARARPKVRYGRTGNPRHVIWAALAASVIWVAAVLAFSWGRFGLPSNPGSAVEAAQSRLGFADWLVILAVIVGPLLLIWVIAWLVRRSMELRDESRKLARAAVLLADAAEIAEKRIAELQPAAMKDGARVAAEIERTNDAIGALRRQFASMQKTLVRQSASLGATVQPSRATVAGAAAGGAMGLLASSDGAAEKTPPADKAPAAEKKPSAEKKSDAPPPVTRAVPPVPERWPPKPPAPVQAEASKPTSKPVAELRADLKSASKAAPWLKLVSDVEAARKAPPKTPQPLAKTIPPPSTPPAPMSPSAQPPATPTIEVSAPPVPRPVAPPPPSARIDPFDDLGPEALKPAATLAALGSGVALGVAADRDEAAAPVVPRLDAATVDDAMPPVPGPDPIMPKAEDMEIMSRKLEWKKFVRAANFPESENDTATLDALYDVLTDPGAAALLQSSEDVLATLADIDLYMEDFVAEMSPVTTWRAHLDGKASLNAINAPVEQSRIEAKLRNDAEFRKLSETFFERYRASLKRLFDDPDADDRLAVELADTRSGRAYLLLLGATGKL